MSFSNAMSSRLWGHFRHCPHSGMCMVGCSENSFWGLLKSFYFAALSLMWSLGSEELTGRQSRISALLKGADLRDCCRCLWMKYSRVRHRGEGKSKPVFYKILIRNWKVDRTKSQTSSSRSGIFFTSSTFYIYIWDNKFYIWPSGDRDLPMFCLDAYGAWHKGDGTNTVTEDG